MIRLRPGEDHGLALAAIQIDGGTQSRASLNDQVVNDYAEAIKAGATFPPIIVFYDGKKHWLADGFHRFHAYQKAGKAKVAADVRQGTRRDAILHSVGANETHGLRRTRDDKRRAVLTLLNDAEWSKWTDRQIAAACLVDHKTVAKSRLDVTGEIPSERTYVTKHGTTATMKTAGINAGRTQFQAKASEDNGSFTGGAGAVTGEASRLASGRTDAGEAASVDLPTISDAERDADAIEAAFDRASDEGKALFLARKHLRQESNPATATGGEDVDRSAERASSAVEVGAPVLPERAAVSASSGRPEGRKRLQVAREPINAAEPDVLAATREALSMERGIDQCVTAGETAPNLDPQPVSLTTADKAGDGTPASPATPFAVMSKADQIRLLRPHCQHADDLEKCAGTGRTHCHACKKLAAESEAA